MTTQFDETQHPRGQAGNAGQFRAADPTAAQIKLEGPATPAVAKFRRQMWINDNAVELDVIDVDLRPLLDTHAVDDIDRGAADHDWLVDEAITTGLLKPWAGPYTLDLNTDTLDDYFDTRRAAGALQPVAGTIRRDLTAITASWEGVFDAKQRLERLEIELGKQGVTALLLERYPTAKDVEIYNSLEDDGEVQYQVRRVLDADGNIVYDGEDEDNEEFQEELTEHSIALDRFGMRYLKQEPDSRHGGPWYGFTL
ncbi:hypothetical protein [Agromyces humi]|uniref:hypothetical protein n=1 Tax=Agromyces humi TaxID=1766800 RepID=UPI00135B9F71|nr:hypothetical protein [Agromyces humi]